MSVSFPLPPSGRDFLVYQRVVVENASTRTCAGEFDLSQTRIRQIIQRVVGWLAATLPKEELGPDDAARLRVGQHIAADRMEYLYGNTMEEWRQSKQPKFLGLAIRIIAAQAKIPALAGTIGGIIADAIEGPLPDEVPASSSFGLQISSLDSPPPRDCSPAPAAEPCKAAEPRPTPAASPAAIEACKKLPIADRNARSAFLEPAQASQTVGDDPPVAEWKITPQQLGFSTARHSRRERRRLKRKLGA
jgi:hypothetical protein